MNLDPILMRVAGRLVFLQACWDPKRMQSVGWAFALDPWLKVCWVDPIKLQDARRRHLEYFNTHPIAAWLMAGMICRQEQEAARAPESLRDQELQKISGLKTNTAAALAGLYDPFFWGALRPMSAVAGLLMAQILYLLGSDHALLGAAVAALLIYNVPAIAARAAGFYFGFTLGQSAPLKLVTIPVKRYGRLLYFSTAAAAAVCAVISLGGLGDFERVAALVTIGAGIAMSWKNISILRQIGWTGAAGVAAAAMGFWP